MPPLFSARWAPLGMLLLLVAHAGASSGAGQSSGSGMNHRRATEAGALWPQQRALMQASSSGSALPAPVAFFPLTGGSLDSSTGAYKGGGDNLTWVPSAGPGSQTVLACNKTANSTARLDPVPYGRSGRWAVSIWLTPTPLGLAGNQFEYIFSHQNAAETYPTGWEANQIRLFFPQLGHPAFGVLRAIVKDGTETSTDNSAQSFLDSDGGVGQRTRNATSAALRSGATALQDGQWHMLTLSTLAAGRGFAMFLDGSLVGIMNSSAVQQAGFATVDGGGPMDLTDRIFLCGRSEGNQTRGYDGQLAGLAIFDTQLSPDQVQALFAGTRPSGGRAAPGPLPPTLPAAPQPQGPTTAPQQAAQVPVPGQSRQPGAAAAAPPPPRRPQQPDSICFLNGNNLCD